MSKKTGDGVGVERLAKITADVPAHIDVRAYALARSLGIPKRVLIGKLLDAGLRKYERDREFRELIGGLMGPAESAA